MKKNIKILMICLTLTIGLTSTKKTEASMLACAAAILPTTQAAMGFFGNNFITVPLTGEYLAWRGKEVGNGIGQVALRGMLPVAAIVWTSYIIYRTVNHITYIPNHSHPITSYQSNPVQTPLPLEKEKISIFDGVSMSKNLKNSEKSFSMFSDESKNRINQAIKDFQFETSFDAPLTQYLFEGKNTSTSLQGTRYLAYKNNMDHLSISASQLINEQYDLESTITDLFNWANAGSSTTKRMIVITDFEVMSKPNLRARNELTDKYIQKLQSFLASISKKFSIIGITQEKRLPLKELPRDKIKPILIETKS